MVLNSINLKKLKTFKLYKYLVKASKAFSKIVYSLYIKYKSVVYTCSSNEY